MPSMPSSPFKSRHSVGPSSTMGTSLGTGMGIGLPVTGKRSTSPLPPQLPPKTIDLNSSTLSTDRETGTKFTQRAFLCDVVVESEGEETTNLLAQLGETIAPLSAIPPPPPLPTISRPASPSSGDDEDSATQCSLAKREDMSKRLGSLIEELVRTERSYVSRLRALKLSYADPLRHFAKQGYSVIVPMYEAKTLFANIDALLPSATVFLADLEAMWDSGQAEDTVGDVCLKHFRDLKTFDPYRTYLSKQDESQKIFTELSKKVTAFNSFIESTKHQTTGIGNIGLRELLMEPVQRIPRYTLLWSTMIKYMPPVSTQRAKLVEAIEIASRIARCEADAQTVRATIMYCLQRNVENFPANLFSNNRDYIDSIDVEDVPPEHITTPQHRLSRQSSRPMSITSTTSSSIPSLASHGSTASSNAGGLSSPQKDSNNYNNNSGNGNAPQPLHCTLFLFDDKLMIVKRQSATISGRKVTGLDDVAKLVKSGGGVAVMDRESAKKDKLSFRGTVDILDVIAADVGEGDFHLFLERPPMDQSDRWSARPFRSFSTVQPPYAIVLDPPAARRDKLRFVQNLWAAQALARAKRLPTQVSAMGPPRVLKGMEEIGLDIAGEPFAKARCYYDVWQRGSWMAETRKAKVAIHIDEDGSNPELLMSEEDDECEIATDPRLVIRLQPLPGGLCRFSYSTSLGENEEKTIIALSEITEKIVLTIAKLNIFRFRTATNSAPATPSSTAHRLRPAMLNLDTISRNLFGAGSISTRTSISIGNSTGGDTFGAPIGTGSAGTKRTRSIASKSSAAESSTTGGVSAHRGGSGAAGGVGSVSSVSDSNRLSVEMRSATSSDSHASGSGMAIGHGHNHSHTHSHNLHGINKRTSRSSMSPSPGLTMHPDEAEEEEAEKMAKVERDVCGSSGGGATAIGGGGLNVDGERDSLEVLISPFRGGRKSMDASEVDLNERLNLARKNSRTVAKMGGGEGGSRSGLRLGDGVGVGHATRSKSTSEWDKAEADLRAALGSESLSYTPTAPLRIVKTPSPTRGLRGDTPRAKVTSPTVLPTRTGSITNTAVAAREYGSPEPMSPTSASGYGSRLVGPRSLSPETTGQAVSGRGPLPPTPVGMSRLALPSITTTTGNMSVQDMTVSTGSNSINSPSVTPGSSHTRLRVVSGNGRRVSPSRKTIPLKGSSEEDDGQQVISGGGRNLNRLVSTPQNASRSSAVASYSGIALSPLSPVSPFSVPSVLPGASPRSNMVVGTDGVGNGGSGGNRVVSAGKRQYSGDELSNTGPRKRSPSRSPLHPRVTNDENDNNRRSDSGLDQEEGNGSGNGCGVFVADGSKLLDPLKVPSLNKRTGTPRKVSGGTARVQSRTFIAGGTGGKPMMSGGSTGVGSRSTTPTPMPTPTPRRVSGGSLGISFGDGGERGKEVEILNSEEGRDVMERMKQKINDSRVTVRRLKADAAALRKHIATSREREKERDVHRGKSGGEKGVGIDRTPSLPRSPQSRNIHRQAEYMMNNNDLSPARGFSGGSGSGRSEFDAIVMDEHVKGILMTLERLETGLKSVMGDAERLELANCIGNGDDERKFEIASLESQLGRAKEREELVRQQLAASQIEVEEIYKAFNTELDALYADAQIRPESEALILARKEIQKALKDRNDLNLENRRLKAELEEEKLKREQWAKMLRSQGLIP